MKVYQFFLMFGAFFFMTLLSAKTRRELGIMMLMIGAVLALATYAGFLP